MMAGTQNRQSNERDIGVGSAMPQQETTEVSVSAPDGAYYRIEFSGGIESGPETTDHELTWCRHGRIHKGTNIDREEMINEGARALFEITFADNLIEAINTFDYAEISSDSYYGEIGNDCSSFTGWRGARGTGAATLDNQNPPPVNPGEFGANEMRVEIDNIAAGIVPQGEARTFLERTGAMAEDVVTSGETHNWVGSGEVTVTNLSTQDQNGNPSGSVQVGVGGEDTTISPGDTTTVSESDQQPDDGGDGGDDGGDGGDGGNGDQPPADGGDGGDGGIGGTGITRDQAFLGASAAIGASAIVIATR